MSLIPWRVKKLDDDSFAYLVPDAEIHTDANKMCARVIVSTETIDRERDILIARGLRTKSHKSNPIVLANHNRNMPVGMAEDAGGNYTVKSYDDHVEAVHYFNQKSKLGTQTFRLVESKALRGISPGFLTVPDKVRKVKGYDGQPAFVHDEWDLVEISHVPIPMNPEALVLAVEKGFGDEALLPELKELLLPFVPEKKEMVTGGWDVKGTTDDDTTYDLESILAGADAEGDGVLPPLTSSSQFYQSVHAKAKDFSGFVQELGATQEVLRTKSDTRRVAALLGGIMRVCELGQRDHVAEFSEQPGIPGEPGFETTDKLLAEWVAKSMEAWDEWKASHRRVVAAEDTGVIKKSADLYKTLAADHSLPNRVRMVCKRASKDLAAVRFIAPPSDAEDEMLAQAAKVLSETNAKLEGMKPLKVG